MAETGERLGEKIRRMRKKRGLTQSALAGDKITRNMLSLIESGKAAPSVETLTYIAERLDVPAGYLIPRDRSEEDQMLRMTFIEELRDAYKNRDWKKCVGKCPVLSDPDDEISYILASSHLMLACEAADMLDISTAFSELMTAEKYGRGSVYCGVTFSGAVEYCRRLFSSLCTDEIPQELCDAAGIGELLPYEIPAYFISLKNLRAGESGTFPLELSSFRAEHIKAVLLSMEEDYTEAIRILRHLDDSQSLPCYMRYRVLCDLETAADLSGNVRLAYSASRKKLEMIDKCKINEK